MTQEEIDSLLEGIKSGQAVDVNDQRLGATDTSRKLDRALNRMVSRVAFYRENNYPWPLIREAERELHRIGFKRWLYNHNLNEHEYVLFIRGIIEERGLMWYPWLPPGYKLAPKNDRFIS